MTIQASEDFAANARKAGIASLVEKPFSDEALFAAIHSALLGPTARAVLAVIQSEARVNGECTLSVAEIAKRANVGKAKVRAAIRLAWSLGTIETECTPNRRRVIFNRPLLS
jgi:hypothetical protein